MASSYEVEKMGSNPFVYDRLETMLEWAKFKILDDRFRTITSTVAFTGRVTKPVVLYQTVRKYSQMPHPDEVEQLMKRNGHKPFAIEDFLAMVLGGGMDVVYSSRDMVLHGQVVDGYWPVLSAFAYKGRVQGRHLQLRSHHKPGDCFPAFE